MAVLNSQKGFRGLAVLSFETRRSELTGQLIEKHGGRPWMVPSVREIPVTEAPLREVNEELESGRIQSVLFMTGVGFRYLLESMEKIGLKTRYLDEMAKIRIYARGPKPEAALKHAGLRNFEVIPPPHTSKEILAALSEKERGATLLIAEYGDQNEDLERSLRANKIKVRPLAIYRWALPEDTGPLEEAVSDCIAGRVPLLLFTSAVQFHNLMKVAARDANDLIEALSRTKIASIGPVTAGALQAKGLAPFIASEGKLAIFVRETAEWIAGDEKKS